MPFPIPDAADLGLEAQASGFGPGRGCPMADPDPVPDPDLKFAVDFDTVSPMPRYRSLQALLSNIVDYAGTFPPAALSLSETLKKAATFRSTATHPWILGRVAMSSAHLRELTFEKIFESGADGTPWVFTAICDPLDANNPAAGLLHEWKWAEEFNAKHSGTSLSLSIESLEWKIAEQTDLDSLRTALRALAVTASSPRRLYFEAAPSAQAGLAELLEEAKRGTHAPDFGLKVRTGGQVVPSSEDLARTILLCRQHSLLFKATQGLHHALSRSGAFGFVNLFFALCVAQAHSQVDSAALIQCLDADKVRFDDESVQLGSYELSREEIENARSKHRGCFGSCSVDEPDQFLTEEI